ncbi:MAG: Zn-ribbon domain-containing OB-fold protein, partial [Caulobacterales bacterium]
ACPSCGARGTFQSYEVARTGTLRAFSIVHRSFPGVATPFVSAVADMADGTVLKGNLRGVTPTPEAVALGMPIKLVLDDAGRTDSKGNRYIAYFFEAA